jgi:hypothetical protein
MKFAILAAAVLTTSIGSVRAQTAPRSSPASNNDGNHQAAAKTVGRAHSAQTKIPPRRMPSGTKRGALSAEGTLTRNNIPPYGQHARP